MDTNYYVFIHRPGPNWISGKPITAQPLSDHFDYMTDLESKGLLVLGGGFLDSSGAMGILNVQSREAAEHIVLEDPAVRDGVVSAEVHPMVVTVSHKIDVS